MDPNTSLDNSDPSFKSRSKPSSTLIDRLHCEDPWGWARGHCIEFTSPMAFTQLAYSYISCTKLRDDHILVAVTGIFDDSVSISEDSPQ